jgi:hypothetical protein
VDELLRSLTSDHATTLMSVGVPIPTLLLRFSDTIHGWGFIHQDWVAQTSIKFKSQLNLKCKLISCKFKCQLSLNWHLKLNEVCATQSGLSNPVC